VSHGPGSHSQHSRGDARQFRQKAELKGKSLEQELRDLLEANRKFTPEERAALADRFRSGSRAGPALTLDEIREGLE
jgi:hypothetical protein